MLKKTAISIICAASLFASSVDYVKDFIQFDKNITEEQVKDINDKETSKILAEYNTMTSNLLDSLQLECIKLTFGNTNKQQDFIYGKLIDITIEITKSLLKTTMAKNHNSFREKTQDLQYILYTTRTLINYNADPYYSFLLEELQEMLVSNKDFSFIEYGKKLIKSKEDLEIALKEVDDMEKHPERYTTYNSIEDLKKALNLNV